MLKSNIQIDNFTNNFNSYLSKSFNDYKTKTDINIDNIIIIPKLNKTRKKSCHCSQCQCNDFTNLQKTSKLLDYKIKNHEKKLELRRIELQKLQNNEFLKLKTMNKKNSKKNKKLKFIFLVIRKSEMNKLAGIHNFISSLPSNRNIKDNSSLRETNEIDLKKNSIYSADLIIPNKYSINNKRKSTAENYFRAPNSATFQKRNSIFNKNLDKDKINEKSNFLEIRRKTESAINVNYDRHKIYNNLINNKSLKAKELELQRLLIRKEPFEKQFFKKINDYKLNFDVFHNSRIKSPYSYKLVFPKP